MKTRLIAALLVLTSASAASAKGDELAQALVPGRTPAEVLTKITAACMSQQYLVEESTASSVVCSRTSTGVRAALGQALIGNSYSTTPVVKLRIVAVTVGADTELQAQQWVETTMAFGQVRKVALSSKKLQRDLDMMVANMPPQATPEASQPRPKESEPIKP